MELGENLKEKDLGQSFVSKYYKILGNLDKLMQWYSSSSCLWWKNLKGEILKVEKKSKEDLKSKIEFFDLRRYNFDIQSVISQPSSDEGYLVYTSGIVSSSLEDLKGEFFHVVKLAPCSRGHVIRNDIFDLRVTRPSSDLTESLVSSRIPSLVKPLDLKEDQVIINYRIGKCGKGTTTLCGGSSEIELRCTLLKHVDHKSLISHFNLLKQWRSSYIVKVFFCNDKSDDNILAVEEFYDVDEWLDFQYDGFRLDGRQWFKKLAPQFFFKFRGVLEGLKQLYQKQTYHGDIEHGIALWNTGGKLYNMKENLHGIDFTDGVKRDLKILKKVMVKVIEYWHRRSGVECPEYDAMGVPDRLVDFFTSLETYSGGSALPLLDDPLFWGPERRYDFMEKMYQLIWKEKQKLPVKAFNRCCAGIIGHWSSSVPQDDYLKDVYDRKESNQGLTVEQSVKQYRNTGSDLIRFWRNCHSHYNDYCPAYMDKIALDAKLDKAFGACGLVFSTMLKFLFQQPKLWKDYDVKNVKACREFLKGYFGVPMT